jgi:tRNA-specific 2-thiouridylase
VAVQGCDHPLLLCSSLHAVRMHWINGLPPALARGETLHALARIRHRQPLQQVRVEALPEGPLRVRFERPQRGVAPGQYVVFYEGQTCLGGGSIRAADAASSPARQPRPVQARTRA